MNEKKDVQTLTPVQESDFDQTMFSTEVLFENPTLPKPPVVVTPPTEKKKTPVWKQKKVFIPVVILVILFLFVSLIALAPKQKKLKKVIKNDVLVIQHPQQNALKARIDEVNSDLQNADPSRMDLPFPPIEKNIAIE